MVLGVLRMLLAKEHGLFRGRTMAALEDGSESPGQPPNPGASWPENIRAAERNGNLPVWHERETCRDILHGLNNALVSILLNAQVIGWKLPSYSRLKRNVHEVERSAQRGGLLVQRLRNWLETGAAGGSSQVERESQYTAVDTWQIGTDHAEVPPGGKAVDSENAAGIVMGG